MWSEGHRKSSRPACNSTMKSRVWLRVHFWLWALLLSGVQVLSRSLHPCSDLPSVSMNLPILFISDKWNYRIYGPLCLASFTLHDVFRVYSGCSTDHWFLNFFLRSKMLWTEIVGGTSVCNTDRSRGTLMEARRISCLLGSTQPSVSPEYLCRTQDITEGSLKGLALDPLSNAFRCKDLSLRVYFKNANHPTSHFHLN